MNRFLRRAGLAGLAAAALVSLAATAQARLLETDPEYKDLQALEQEFGVARGGSNSTGIKPGAQPADIPDIFGPGAVLTVGNVIMKVTNYGLVGNPFTNVSTDPSCQWPGASGIEYMNYVGLGVGAVNPLATDPTAVRRVSYITEWRPPTLDKEDRMYRAYDGIINGTRFVNDDSDSDPLTGDPLIDEDFLDGRDNDGDGKIDEDYGAIGQMVWSCVIRDDTQQAIQAAASERHVPLGLETRQTAWAYSIPGYTDFNIVQWDIYNRSGHELDSVFVAVRSDMDCGPVDKADYYSDDFNMPQYPFGYFMVKTKDDDGRLQSASTHDPQVGDPNAPLCPEYKIRIQGYSCLDDDNDENKTPGVPSVFLIYHSTDPTGVSGPMNIGMRAFRSWTGGTPYTQGGAPTIDQQRFEFMSSEENVDPPTDSNGDGVDDQPGFINLAPGDQKGDYTDMWSVGPWRHWPNNGMIRLTIGIGVALGDYKEGSIQRYPSEYAAVADPATHVVSANDAPALLERYPSLANAYAAQVAFEGKYDDTDWTPLPTGHGKEYCVKAPPGQILSLQGCGDLAPTIVNDRDYSCFDMDCSYCTGAYDFSRKRGLFHRTWLAEAPPPSPSTNMSVLYNYTDNPDRKYPPAGDGKITIAWDNLSETSVDPKSGQFDFRGYRIWKVSNWQRPVGSAGPAEDDWTLLAEYRIFDYAANNRATNQCPPESVTAGVCTAADTLCPLVYIPQKEAYERVCLQYGDLFDRQSGDVIRPDPSVLCSNWPDCDYSEGWLNGQSSGPKSRRIKYPIGRYRYVDTNVKNGFLYFYSVTALDSTGSGDHIAELGSRRSAVEAEGVVPQSSVNAKKMSGKKVWVVPNPYRGSRFIADRPSAWDLTPNASDPTGTHIDFLGLPAGEWRIKIFTVSGDLVVELNAKDAVNESLRGGEVTDDEGGKHPGFNRQQDTPDDGQARWNLISRNGQDVVSGIYLYTVEVGGSVVYRDKFVIIR